MQSSPPPYPPYVAPQKTGVPALVWVLLGGCGCMLVCLFLMAAVLLPVFNTARHKARQVISDRSRCLSNMRMMGTATLMYAQDYDEHLPLAKSWTTGLYPYIKMDTVFQCPTVNPTGAVVYSYGFNSELSQISMDQILTPASAVLLFESDKKKRDANDALKSVANPPRHSGGNVFGFVDGHAKWLSGVNALDGGHTPTLKNSAKQKGSK